MMTIKSDTTFAAPVSKTEIVGSDPDDTSSWPTPTTPDGLIDGAGELTMPSTGKITGELVIEAELTNNGLVQADDRIPVMIGSGHSSK